MIEYKREFVNFLIDSGALKFGDFITKSGRKSPYFINIGDLNKGSQLKKLGEYYARAIMQTFGNDISILFGPAYKGIPIATAVCQSLFELSGLDARFSSIRKEAKEHGDAGIFLGAKIKNGDKIVIVEDVTTAGTSVKETMEAVMPLGAEVLGLIISVDRMEKGNNNISALQEIAETYKIKTSAIITLDDIIEVVSKDLSAQELEAIKQYRTTYGV